MIAETAMNQDLGINTPQKNVAVRVNIHFQRQTMIGKPDLGDMDYDDDWED